MGAVGAGIAGDVVGNWEVSADSSVCCDGDGSGEGGVGGAMAACSWLEFCSVGLRFARGAALSAGTLSDDD